MHAGSDDASMDGSQEGPEETLVEFRAGLMRVQGSQLEADPRRGLVRLQQVRWVGRRGVRAPRCAPRRVGHAPPVGTMRWST